mgnify:FL=1
MKVSELIALLQRPGVTADMNVMIRVYRPGSIGGQPVTGIKQAHAGIDWDKGKFILYPEAELTKLSDEEVRAIREHAGSLQSYAMYQVQKEHAAEIECLKTRIAELEGPTP